MTNVLARQTTEWLQKYKKLQQIALKCTQSEFCPYICDVLCAVSKYYKYDHVYIMLLVFRKFN